MAFGDIVQTAEDDSNSTASITVTPSSAPTDGNLVLLLHAYNDDTNTRTAEPSPGSTTYEQAVTSTAANPDHHLKAWWGIASSEPSSYTVTTSANEDHAIAYIEIEGPFVADGDPADSDNHVNTNSGTGDTAIPTASVTTTVLLTRCCSLCWVSTRTTMIWGRGPTRSPNRSRTLALPTSSLTSPSLLVWLALRVLTTLRPPPPFLLVGRRLSSDWPKGRRRSGCRRRVGCSLRLGLESDDTTKFLCRMDQT